MTKIAVIGAGLAGLVLSRELSRHYDVTVFEKSRGVGGRMSTRYAGDFEFDHGAQFFTAQSQRFRSFLQPLIDQGVVRAWPARFAELDGNKLVSNKTWAIDHARYVGAPRMNAIGKHLARGLDVRLQQTVGHLERTDNRWMLFDSQASTLGSFDWVVCTAPAAQTAALCPATSSVYQAGKAARMKACFALMLGFDQEIDLTFDAAEIRGRDISWISANSSKPGRPDGTSFVVHSTNEWADDHLLDDPDAVTSHLLSELFYATGLAEVEPQFCRLHRWRYASITRQNGVTHAIDEERKLAACGDWFIRGRIEAAFTSAVSLSDALANGNYL